MKRIFALLLLASPVVPAVTGFAIGQEVKYVTPEIPTEAGKDRSPQDGLRAERQQHGPSP